MLQSESALVAGRYHSGTFHRPVAFLLFDILRLSHQNLSHEDPLCVNISETPAPEVLSRGVQKEVRRQPSTRVP